MRLRELGEFGLIDRWNARLTKRDGVILGIGDDAAVLAAMKSPVVTCDALVEGVHFRRDWTTARALGRKAMSVNVSDIAAMGAQPIAAFVNLSLSAAMVESADTLAWLDELYAGFEDVANMHNFTVAGGDIARAPHDFSIGVTLVGEAAGETQRQSTPVLRAGAAPGDVLIVTGTLGDAAAGLFLLAHPQCETDSAAREYVLQRHREPTARLREMQAALCVQNAQGTRAITAALDLSDGLVGDAKHLARRSGIAAAIETGCLPISESARCVARDAAAQGFEVNALEWALGGGEDYELLLAVSAEYADAVCAAITSATSTQATIIGHCEGSTPTVTLVSADGTREKAGDAWRHF